MVLLHRNGFVNAQATNYGNGYKRQPLVAPDGLAAGSFGARPLIQTAANAAELRLLRSQAKI